MNNAITRATTVEEERDEEDEEEGSTWVNAVHATVSRMYHTNSRIAGVRTELPRSVRVEHKSHDEFGGTATLEYNEERKDHVLTKVEAVPGLREENDLGFSWIDPVTGEQRGGLVALPPAEWAHWDAKKRCWTCKASSTRLSGSAQCWPAMRGPPLEGRVSDDQLYSSTLAVVGGSALFFLAFFSRRAYPFLYRKDAPSLSHKYSRPIFLCSPPRLPGVLPRLCLGLGGADRRGRGRAVQGGAPW